jgi:hypothetical protein
MHFSLLTIYSALIYNTKKKPIMQKQQNTSNNSISLFLVIIIIYLIFNIFFFGLNYYVFKNLFPNNFNNFYSKIQNYSIPGIILSGYMSTLLISEPTLRFSISEVNKSNFKKVIIPLIIFPMFYYLDYKINTGFAIFQILWLIFNFIFTSNILHSQENYLSNIDTNIILKNKYNFLYSILTIFLNSSILSILFKEKLDIFNISWIFVLSIITIVHSQFLFYIKNKFTNSTIFIILFLIISFSIPMFLSLYKY